MAKHMAKVAEARFERLFAQCREDVNGALRDLLAAQSAIGALRSGSTIGKSAQLFEDHSLRALNACTSDIGKQVEDRGKNWRRMLASLRTVLEAHIEQGPAVLSQSALTIHPNFYRILDPLLDKTAIRLHQNLADFEEGWTAPKGKLWHERYPVTHRLLLIAAGAVPGAVAGAVSKDLSWSAPYVQSFTAFLRSLF